MQSVSFVLKREDNKVKVKAPVNIKKRFTGENFDKTNMLTSLSLVPILFSRPMTPIS